MYDLNDCKLRGNMVRDPIVRVGKANKPYVIFTLGVDRNQTKKTDYISFVAFGKMADFIEKYGKKGRLVAIDESAYREENWKDNDGNWHNMHNFVVSKFKFLDKMPNDPIPAAAVNNEAEDDFEVANQNAFANGPEFIPASNDEPPF